VDADDASNRSMLPTTTSFVEKGEREKDFCVSADGGDGSLGSHELVVGGDCYLLYIRLSASTG